VRVFLWHVHGSYTTSLAQGGHELFVPVEPGRGPDGRGRALTWDWPDRVQEVSRTQARDLDVDVVVLQRPEELDRLCEEWLGRRPGADVRTVYLEHNAPQGRIDDMHHPAADRPDLVVVHVTHFNALFWDCGRTPTRVIEHGIPDPGHLFDGELPRVVAALNEPLRRGRVTGTDLLPRLTERRPVDLFGMRAEEVAPLLGPLSAAHPDLPQAALHREMARRRAYLHPVRWTSLGLSLIEAMHLGLPVVALATTEAVEAVPPDAGVLSNRLDVVERALDRFVSDREDARTTGARAREVALERFGIDRFLHDWDRLLEEVTS
jgi:glycosyltransferase involved in cell wall biosynthesis